MSATSPSARHAPGSAVPPRGIVRLRPETWGLLASLRRPIIDSEGNLVGLESFDRLVRRLIDEQRPSKADRPASTHGGAR